MTGIKSAHPHLIVFPGPEKGVVLSGEGERLVPPEGWAFLPAGDAGVTRRVKSKGPVWVVQVTRGRRKMSKGVWADAGHISQAESEVAQKRSAPSYARQQERAAARRQALHQAYVTEFCDQVVRFLDFHPRYETEARLLGEKISAHATPVGSGTVARTRRIPVEKRAEAAVIAWMRHKTTAYDAMKIARVKGRRRQVRRQLARVSNELLNIYRQGKDAGPSCPLKRALEALRHDQ